MTDKKQGYWKANIRLIQTLLVFWFLASFGAGIIFIDQLDSIKIGGFPLGFWFSEQGSIYVFLILIIVYTIKMNKLDKEYDVEE